MHLIAALRRASRVLKKSGQLDQPKCAYNHPLGCVIIGPGVGRLELCEVVAVPQNEYSSEVDGEVVGKLSEATLRSDYNLFTLFMNAGRVQICPLPVVGGIADETALSPSGSQCLASQPIPTRHALLHVTALCSLYTTTPRLISVKSPGKQKRHSVIR